LSGAAIAQACLLALCFTSPRTISFNQPQTFVAFGAAGHPRTVQLRAWRLSLAEAVGKQDGLNDGLADPSLVFLYRGETRDVAAKLGVDWTKFAGPIIPIIYHANFRDPSGYFLAQSFEMRNKDVLLHLEFACGRNP
jgi:polysaccharide export outer membrane protein